MPAHAMQGETPFPAGAVDAVLTLPGDAPRPAVALLIAGSGPTDRDGNGPFGKPATLKKLSDGLLARQIATLRYDKRAMPRWKPAFGRPEDFRFSHFVDDAVMLVAALRARDAFSRIVLIGHSEGALVASLAARRVPVDGLVLLTATSRRQADLLKAQLAPQMDAASFAVVAKVIDAITAGQIVTDPPPGLRMPPAAQPGLASAFREDPLAALRGLSQPVLIIGGGRDRQVARSDFDDLAKAASHAQTLWRADMNHVLTEVSDAADDLAAYSQPERPLDPAVIPAIADFIATLGDAAR